MASVKDIERSILEVFFLNFYSKKNMGITLMISGPHGTGKTQIVYKAAKRIGAHVISTDGSIVNQGELAGLPLPFINSKGITEFKFIKHPGIRTIEEAEEYYYNKAITDGFLNETIKLTDKGIQIKDDGKTRLIEVNRTIFDGKENQFKFGNELPAELKIKLVESGEISPVILFIDELNRADPQVMKEMMNIILNKNINGYDLPWWVSIVTAVNPSSQNSTYSTNELDDAQRDRFVKIVMNARLDEWVDYALSENISTNVISAIAISEDIFMTKDKSHDDTDEQRPSPRSWEMVGIFYSYLKHIMDIKFFTNEDRKYFEEDLRMLINAKVGPNAGRTFWHNINNLNDLVYPEEIINGKSEKIAPEILEKLKNQRAISKKITSHNVTDYLAKVITDFETKKNSGKAEGKKAYVNFMEQLKQYVSNMDDSTRLLFVKRIGDLDKIVAADGHNLFFKISSCFSKETLEQISDIEINIKNLNKD